VVEVVVEGGECRDCGPPADCIDSGVTLGFAVCKALAGNLFVPPSDFCEVYDVVATAYLAIPKPTSPSQTRWVLMTA
jgi:hypothetical protein